MPYNLPLCSLSLNFPKFLLESIEKGILLNFGEELSSNLSYKDCESDWRDWEKNEENNEKLFPTVVPVDLVEQAEKENRRPKGELTVSD